MTSSRSAKPLVSREARRQQKSRPAEPVEGEEAGEHLEEVNGTGNGRRMRRRLDLDGGPVKFGLRIHPRLLRAVDLASWDMDLGQSEFIERAVARYLVECGYTVPGIASSLDGEGSSLSG